VRQVTNDEEVVRLQQEVKLDPGESEAIALALELKADLLFPTQTETNRKGAI